MSMTSNENQNTPDAPLPEEENNEAPRQGNPDFERQPSTNATTTPRIKNT